MTADDIRPRREALGLSQAELAVAAGVHPATVQRLESGRAEDSSKRRTKYAKRIRQHTLTAIEAALRKAEGKR